MNTTILLSTQRSGTVYIDSKLNGMCDINIHGGELIFPHFYERHNVKEFMLDGDNLDDKSKYTKIQGTNDQYYFEPKKENLEAIVKKSKFAMFNVMINAIKNDVEIIKQIKTPILFLIRKNLWKKSISNFVLQTKNATAHVRSEKQNTINVTINKEQLVKNCEELFPIICKFQKQLKNKKNVKIIYYEDVQNKEYWTDEFINELEDFMKVKFTNKNFIPPFKKTRNFVNIINEEEIMDEEYIKKYYIKEI